MKKKLFRGLAAALCAAMMAGNAALPAYAAGPSRESVPYTDSYASYQWAFLNTGELRLVPSHTAAVDAAIGAITGQPGALSRWNGPFSGRDRYEYCPGLEEI